MTAVQDYSTRRLKRFYWRRLRRAWWLEPHRLDGFSRNIGLSGDFWRAHDDARNAGAELKRRGVYLP